MTVVNKGGLCTTKKAYKALSTLTIVKINKAL